MTADGWLEAIDRSGRELLDAPSAIVALDEMEAQGARPTIGWMLRNTRKRVGA